MSAEALVLVAKAVEIKSSMAQGRETDMKLGLGTAPC